MEYYWVSAVYSHHTGIKFSGRTYMSLELNRNASQKDIIWDKVYKTNVLIYKIDLKTKFGED